jgi:hypothetical protein
VARFALLPPQPGIVAVITPRQFGCPAVLPQHIRVRGVRIAVTG